MQTDVVATSSAETDAEVMASVEDGPVQRFIVADVSQDDAFMTVPLADAASLPAWR
jgi:hypothetical protein